MKEFRRSAKKQKSMMFPVIVRCEAEMLMHLKTVAMQESFIRSQDISWSDIITESVLKAYPKATASINPGPIVTRNGDGLLTCTWNGGSETFHESELELDGSEFDLELPF